ncbi:hypothetical protein [Methanothrix sp.]|uniref:hypothetical protein n=1 Tax=Methanothrix sp. TaxID=90426 RepID=UPI003BB509C0
MTEKEISSWGASWRPHLCRGQIALTFSDASTADLSELIQADFEPMVDLLKASGQHFCDVATEAIRLVPAA